MKNTDQNIEIGIYFIPEYGKFYSLGSRVVGYDIRKKRFIGKSKKNNSKNLVYGFHLTITDVIEIEKHTLSKVIRILNKVVKNKLFKNIKLNIKKIGKMPNANIVAIQYKQNIQLLFLHSVLAFLVQRLGVDSYYNKRSTNLSLLRKIKTKIFLSPYILNDFLPHVSLLSLSKKNATKSLKRLKEQFKSYSEVNIESVCLVSRKKSENHFTILKEFKLG